MKRRLTTVVFPIIFLNIMFFILQMVMGDSFTSALVLHKGDLLVRPWTLLTSMFMHANVWHIFFNMYVLLAFGPLLEQRIGAKRFLFAYVICGLAAGIVSSELSVLCDFMPLIPDNFCFEAALGASGAIMGVLGIIMILMPKLPVVLFFFIPMELWMAVALFALLDIFGVIPGVASAAHLVGLGAGILYGMSLKQEKHEYHKKFVRKMELDDSDIEEYLKSGRI
jgi:uncharacterized protein